MTSIAIILLTVAAAAHAGWNLLGKRVHPSSAFFMMAMCAAALLMAPLVVWYGDRLAVVPGRVWLLAAAAAASQAFYFIALAAAYRHGHMSIAYPLARSLPVVLVTATTLVRFPERHLSAAFAAGVAMVIVGCIVLPMRHLSDLRLRNYLNVSCLMAVVAALGIAGFTIADGQAMVTLGRLGDPVLSSVPGRMIYYCIEIGGGGLLVLASILAVPQTRRQLGSEARRNWRTSLGCGLIFALAYTAVLTAMVHVTDVSYVIAYTQLSIPLGALLGVLVLKEPRPVLKFVGVALMLAGVVFVSLG
ncbi:MAG: hypothetical protein JXL80_13100 [Planctomycetes bacterium]|nr:hypothetical protein [Planctomycetota bacterium]